jgi:heavy metal sensor kinase
MTIDLKIRTKLTLAYTAIVSVLFAILGVALYVGLYVQLNYAADQDLRSRATGIGRFLERQDQRDHEGGLADELREHSDFNSRNNLSQIRDGNGQWLYRSPGIEALVLPPMKSQGRANIRAGHRSFRVLHREVNTASGHYVLDVAVDRTEYVEALDRLVSLLLLGVPASLLLSFFAGLWMSGRALRPIAQIAGTVREIDDRRLAVRLPLAGSGDELDVLSTTLNGMLDRLQHAFDRISRFTADASHELRTPLALIRGNAEMMRVESRLPVEAEDRVADILAEADRMQSLIESLLELARSDDASSGSFELIDPADLTSRASDVGRHLAEERSVRFRVQEPKAIYPVRGNYMALSRVLLILLDNAMRHTEKGGEVGLEVTSSAKECRMAVRDTGCGIGADDLPHIFDRFYRADASRTRATGGAGLGLAIAREIVLAHGGTIAVESVVEHGSTFVVSIPSQNT